MVRSGYWLSQIEKLRLWPELFVVFLNYSRWSGTIRQLYVVDLVLVRSVGGLTCGFAEVFGEIKIWDRARAINLSFRQPASRTSLLLLGLRGIRVSFH